MMALARCKQTVDKQLTQRHVSCRAAVVGHPPTAPRTLTRAQAANATDRMLPEPMQSPLVYFRAFLSIASRRAGEATLDAAATVSMFVAEQPRQLQEFLDEVQAAAERDLRGSSNQRLLAPRSSRSSSPQSSTAAGRPEPSAPDLAAVVDELRADIAASRSLLQQLRTSQPVQLIN